jgi:tetratricopeptide (TPR) repeat protein
MKQFLSLVVVAFFVALASAQTPALAPAQQAEILYRQGLAAEKAGDPTAAHKAYAAALKVDPNHANARYGLGQLKLNAGTIAAKGHEAKFGAVKIPEFRLDAASLQESLDALRVIIEKQSNQAVTPNFVIQDPKSQLATAKITLNLKNLPAKGVMQYVMEQAGAKARYDPHAIVISPMPK